MAAGSIRPVSTAATTTPWESRVAATCPAAKTTAARPGPTRRSSGATVKAKAQR